MTNILLQITDDGFTLMGLAVIGSLIWLGLLGWVIGSATKQKEHIAHEKAMINLLTSIAYKLGVENDQINQDIKDVK